MLASRLLEIQGLGLIMEPISNFGARVWPGARESMAKRLLNKRHVSASKLKAMRP